MTVVEYLNNCDLARVREPFEQGKHLHFFFFSSQDSTTFPIFIKFLKRKFHMTTRKVKQLFFLKNRHKKPEYLML